MHTRGHWWRKRRDNETCANLAKMIEKCFRDARVRFREFVRQCGEIRVAFTIRCDYFKSRRGFAARRIRRSELRFNEFSKVRVFHR